MEKGANIEIINRERVIMSAVRQDRRRVLRGEALCEKRSFFAFGYVNGSFHVYGGAFGGAVCTGGCAAGGGV